MTVPVSNIKNDSKPVSYKNLENENTAKIPPATETNAQIADRIIGNAKTVITILSGAATQNLKNIPEVVKFAQGQLGRKETGTWTKADNKSLKRYMGSKFDGLNIKALGELSKNPVEEARAGYTSFTRAKDGLTINIPDKDGLLDDIKNELKRENIPHLPSLETQQDTQIAHDILENTRIALKVIGKEIPINELPERELTRLRTYIKMQLARENTENTRNEKWTKDDTIALQNYQKAKGLRTDGLDIKTLKALSKNPQKFNNPDYTQITREKDGLTLNIPNTKTISNIVSVATKINIVGELPK